MMWKRETPNKNNARAGWKRYTCIFCRRVFRFRFWACALLGATKLPKATLFFPSSPSRFFLWKKRERKKKCYQFFCFRFHISRLWLPSLPDYEYYWARMYIELFFLDLTDRKLLCSFVLFPSFELESLYESFDMINFFPHFRLYVRLSGIVILFRKKIFTSTLPHKQSIKIYYDMYHFTVT